MSQKTMGILIFHEVEVLDSKLMDYAWPPA